jgi:hypothetical protein
MKANLKAGTNDVRELSVNETMDVAGGFGQWVIGFLVGEAIDSLKNDKESVQDRAKRLYDQSRKGQQQ